MPEKYADVEIRWDEDIRLLLEIDEDTASSEDGILLNHAYSDYRGQDIEDAYEAVNEEADLLSEIAAAGWDTDEAAEVIDAYVEAFGPTAGLDAGVAGLVYALSALGATPISSCNGGLVGISSHASDVPHVLFTAGPDVMDRVLMAAKESQVGIVRNNGFAEAFTNHLPNLHALARKLVNYEENNPHTQLGI